MLVVVVEPRWIMIKTIVCFQYSKMGIPEIQKCHQQNYQIMMGIWSSNAMLGDLGRHPNKFKAPGRLWGTKPLGCLGCASPQYQDEKHYCLPLKSAPESSNRGPKKQIEQSIYQQESSICPSCKSSFTSLSLYVCWRFCWSKWWSISETNKLITFVFSILAHSTFRPLVYIPINPGKEDPVPYASKQLRLNIESFPSWNNSHGQGQGIPNVHINHCTWIVLLSLLSITSKLPSLLIKYMLFNQNKLTCWFTIPPTNIETQNHELLDGSSLPNLSLWQGLCELGG